MLGLMRRRGVRAARPALLCCAIASSGLLLCTPEAFATESKPTIDGTSVTNITEHDATIEAQINPQGGETLYEIRLLWQDAHPPSEGEPVTGGIQSQFARIAAGLGGQTVSFALTGLQPGYSYWYLVRAGNRAGAPSGKNLHWFGFHNSVVYSEGWAPNLPYEPLVSFWSVFSTEEAVAKVVRENQERRAQAAKEYEEQQATAARLAAEAAALKRSGEEAHAASAPPAALPPVVACTVPSLKGDTLSVARRAITRHHCRLGKVHWARNRHGP
jgi:hypothetical protein